MMKHSAAYFCDSISSGSLFSISYIGLILCLTNMEYVYTSSRCLRGWTNFERVATNLRPIFHFSGDSFGADRLKIVWQLDYDNVKVSASIINLAQQSSVTVNENVVMINDPPAEVKVLIKATQTIGHSISKMELTLIYSKSNSKMDTNMDVIISNWLNFRDGIGNFPTIAAYVFTWLIFPKRQKSIIIYNSTHILRTIVGLNIAESCLDDFSRGTQYNLCVDRSSDSKNWHCQTFTTDFSRSTTEKLSEKTYLPPEPKVEILGDGKIELSWLPLVLIGSLNPVTVDAYLIRIIDSKGQCVCYDVIAPWLTSFVKGEISRQIDEFIGQLRSGCGLYKSKKLTVSSWPDIPSFRKRSWRFGKNDAAPDILGLPGAFTVHIRSKPKHVYIYPLIAGSPSSFNLRIYGSVAVLPIVRQGAIWGLNLEHYSLNTSILRWKSSGIHTPIIIRIEYVGRLTTTGKKLCFLNGCTQKQPLSNHWTKYSKIGKLSLTQILCVKESTTIATSSLLVNCLRPCVAYKVSAASQRDSRVLTEATFWLPGTIAVPVVTNLQVFAVASGILHINWRLPKNKPDDAKAQYPTCNTTTLAIYVCEADVSSKVCISGDTLIDVLAIEDIKQGEAGIKVKGETYSTNINLPTTLDGKHICVKFASYLNGVNDGRSSFTQSCITGKWKGCRMPCLWPNSYINGSGGALHNSDTAQTYRYGLAEAPFSTRASWSHLAKCAHDTTNGGCQLLTTSLDTIAYCNSEIGGYHMTCPIPSCYDIAIVGCATNLELAVHAVNSLSFKWQKPDAMYEKEIGYAIILRRNPNGPHSSEEIQCATRLPSTSMKSEHLKMESRSLLYSVGCVGMGSTLTIDSVQFDKLYQNTFYELQVIPITVSGKTGATLKKVFKTKLAAPCLPVIDNVKPLGSKSGGSLLLSWSWIENATCGNPSMLDITASAQPPGSSKDVFVPLTVDGLHSDSRTSRTEQIDLLEPCRKYELKIRIKNEAGTSLSIYMNGAVKASAPQVIRSPKLSYRQSAPDAIELGMHFAYPSQCHFKYVIEGKVLNEQRSSKIILDGSKETYEVPDLKDGLIYQFRAGLQNEDNWSTWLEVPTHGVNKNLQFSEISVDILKKKKDGKHSTRCVTRSPLDSSKVYVADDSKLTKTPQDEQLACVRIHWSISDKPTPFFGLLIQILNEKKSCTRLAWIPCTNCLHPYSWKNSSPTTLKALKQKLIECHEDKGLVRSKRTSPEELTSMENLLFSSQFGFGWKTTHRSAELWMLLRSTNKANADGESPLKGFKLRVYAVQANDIYEIVEKQLGKATHLDVAESSFMLAGYLISALVVLTVALVIAIFIIRRRSTAKRLATKYGRIYSGEDDVVDKNREPALPQRVIKTIQSRLPRPISIDDFHLFVRSKASNNWDYFAREFKQLDEHSKTQEVEKKLTCHSGQAPQNRMRNRYRVFFPFDNNRVQLQKPCVLEPPTCGGPVNVSGNLPTTPSDYISASFLTEDCPDTDVEFCKYIAMQAPTALTLPIFWQMVWEQNVSLIVMLTRLYENSKEKCFPYWPMRDLTDVSLMDEQEALLNEERQFGRFGVTMTEHVLNFSYIKRQLVLKKKDTPGAPARTIVQLQMTRWDDFLVPWKDDLQHFLNGFWEERQKMANAEAPVIVHCSAGVGRTGTFIALDLLCQQANKVFANDDSSKINASRRNGQADNQRSRKVKRDSTVPLEVISSHDSHCKLSDNILSKDKRAVNDKVDIYMLVLWLRSQRRRMVLLEVQYSFIFDYLSFFCKKHGGNRTKGEPIYANIQN